MRRLITFALVAALTGCAGAGVSLRSGGSATPVGTTHVPAASSPSSASAPAGGSVHVSRGLAVLIVLGIAANDALQWITTRLRALGTHGGSPPDGASGVTEHGPASGQ